VTIRAFFDRAILDGLTFAPTLTDRPAIQVLDLVLSRAMVERRYSRSILGHHLWFALDASQGAKVRARILTAAGRMGIIDITMRPGESIGEWLGRGLRENLRHEHIVPLLRAAARETGASRVDLTVRAR
jgi:hypothetical protein